MPKKKAASESSDSDSGPEDVSILFYFLKKSNLMDASKLEVVDNEQIEIFSQRTPVKKAKATKNDDGAVVFDLGKNRRATVRSFKGKVLVDIREFYQKDGDMAPGKKGISLSTEQWKLLTENTDAINDAIKEM